MTCRYDGLSALQECVEGLGYTPPSDGGPTLEPVPWDTPPDFGEAPDTEEPSDGPGFWVYGSVVVVAVDEGALIGSLGLPFDLSGVVGPVHMLMESGAGPEEIAAAVMDDPVFMDLIAAMKKAEVIYLQLPIELKDLLGVALEAVGVDVEALPPGKDFDSGDAIAAYMGFEPDDSDAAAGADDVTIEEIPDGLDFYPELPSDSDWEVHYQYDVLGSLLREQIAIPGQVREGRQFHAADRSLLSPMASGGLAPINATVARAQTLGGVRDRVFNQSFDARGNLTEQSWLAWPDPATSSAAMTEDGIMLSPSAFPEAARSFEWNGRGRLSRVMAGGGMSMPMVVGEFWYDDRGQTLGKRQWDPNLGAHVEVRKMGDVFEFTDRDGGVDWTFQYRFGSRLIATRDVNWNTAYVDPALNYSERVRYIGGDHLGSASVVTDELGELAQAVRYEPYGRMREQWGPEAGLRELEPGAVDELFDGKRREVMSMGLSETPWEMEAYDFGARYYMPVLSSWMSADPMTPDAVWEANAYSFVRDNPLTYRDPTGHYIESGIEIASIGIGLWSLGSNLKEGKWGAALLDTAGLAIDGVALAIPLVPGGVGMGIKAARVAKAADNVSDVAAPVVTLADDAFEQGARLVADEGGDAMRGLDTAGDAARGADTPGNLDRGNINRNIVDGVPTDWQGHHLIPVSTAAKFPEMMGRAADLGYDINAASNGIALPSRLDDAADAALPLHYGGHLKSYFTLVEEKLAIVARQFEAGDLTDTDLLQRLRGIEDEIREGLENGSIVLQSPTAKGKL